jgi:hypothetical protein
MDWVRAHPLPDGRIVPVCLWGSSGIGKTKWAGSYCSHRRMGLRSYYPAHDVHGADVVGLGHIDEQIDRTVYARPMWLPTEHDPVIFEREGIIFVDELNRAPREVLRGLLEPIGEGMISHSGWRQPPKWSFLCAANPPSEQADADDLSDAMMNRILHVPASFDVVAWAAWAEGSGLHPDIIAFAAKHPDALATPRESLPEELTIHATPRSVEYLGRLYEPGMDPGLLRLVSEGLLGPTAAIFLTHLEDAEDPVGIDEILNSDGALVRLGAHIASEREDLVEASMSLVLASLSTHRPSQRAAPRVVAYAQALGGGRREAFLARLHDSAPTWERAFAPQPAQPAAPQRRSPRRTAAAEGAGSR